MRLNQIPDPFTQHRADPDIGIQNNGRAGHFGLALVTEAAFFLAFLKSDTMSSGSTPCADSNLSSDWLAFFSATKSASAWHNQPATEAPPIYRARSNEPAAREPIGNLRGTTSATGTQQTRNKMAT
jgi:hypothetical protein